MKKTYLIMLSLCLFGLALPSTVRAADPAKKTAKRGMSFKDFDKNNNGVIDKEEMADVQKAYTADPNGPLKRFDKDKDGKLDETEISAIKPSKQAKADTKTNKKTKKDQ